MKELMLKHKYKIIIGLLLVVSLLINVFSIKSCSNNRDLNNNNIIALSDTIEYYKTKNGELVASKTLLEGDLTTLRVANDSLYNTIKDMNVKELSSVVYIKTTIDNGRKDTVWGTDTVVPNLNISKKFAFNNKYRSLEGSVYATDTTMGLNIMKDQTYVDYVLAVEDNIVKVKSNNPYVKFNEIQGITIPKQKHGAWGFSIGPAVFGGYNPVAGKTTWGIGASLVWGYRIK